MVRKGPRVARGGAPDHKTRHQQLLIAEMRSFF